MALYCLYHYRCLLVTIILDRLNPLTFHNHLNCLPLLCYLCFLQFCVVAWPVFLHFLSLCCSAFSCWGCATFLYKSSVCCNPLLAWCRLVTLFFCVLYFYISHPLALLYCWLGMDSLRRCLVCYVSTQIVYFCLICGKLPLLHLQSL